MKAKLKLKLLVDNLLTLSLLFLMSYSLVGEKVHEIIGILMFILFIIHHIFNRRYLKNICIVNKNLTGYFKNSLILLIFICFIGSMLSGIIESRYLFVFLNIKSSFLTNRIHMLSAYWGFVFMSMHLGCHFKMLKSIFRSKNLPFSNLFKIINILILLYGINAFFKMNILDYLFLKNYFFILDDGDNLLLYVFNYMAIMYSIAYITMLIKDNLLSFNFI